MATTVESSGDFLKITKADGTLFYFHKTRASIKFEESRVILGDFSNASALYIDFSDFEDGEGTGYTTQATIATYLLTIMSTFEDIAINTGGAGDATNVNKFGTNEDVDTGSEEILAAYGGTFTPASVISSAQTFTITYNNTTDGATASGVRTLGITYLDENYEEQTAVHVLGSDGSDVTAFTGFGINRVYCYTFGGDSVSGNDITITATTDATTQAVVLAGKSVTLQCVYHVPINKIFEVDYLNYNVRKISGGGNDPEVVFKLYSYSRVTGGVYEVDDQIVNANLASSLEIRLAQPIVFGGREVIYITAETDTANTKVYGRFSGILENVI